MASKKPEVILIEGIDLSGKSTLWNTIIKAFPGIGIKLTDRPLDSSENERKKIKDYYRAVLGFININYQNKTFIMDRFFPSEMVYSIKRGYDSMRDKELIAFERVLKQRRHIVIYCDPGIETIIERLKTRGDDYISEEDLKGLYARYEAFFRQTTLNFIRVNTNKPIKELLEEIKPIIDGLTNGDNPKQPSLFD